MPQQHSRHGPSKAHRWMPCPGSIPYGECFPDQPNASSIEGTDAHELAQLCISGRKDPKEMLGQKMSLGTVVNEDMIAAITKYIFDSTNLMVGMLHRTVEMLVDISGVLGIEGEMGTADRAGWNDTEIQVHDLKYGFHRVYAKRNPQLMLYALGVLSALLKRGGPRPKTVKLFIHQPRIDWLDEDELTVEELISFATAAQEAAEMTQKAITAFEREDPNFVTDYLAAGDHCKWCPAARGSSGSLCPELERFTQMVLAGDFESMPNIGDEIVPRDYISLPPEAKAWLLKQLPTIRTFCDGVEKSVQEDLRNGIKIPGWKLVVGRKGNRTWFDAELVENLMKKLKVKSTVMYIKSLISPAQAEKVLKAKKPEVWEQLNGMVSQRPGAPQLALESDKREAWVPETSSSDFDDMK